MGQPARNSGQEYWRPANPEVMRLVERPLIGPRCWRCEEEYVAGARFCHVCGSEREPRASQPVADDVSLTESQNQSLRRRLGLSKPSLVFLILGLICLVAAAVTGAIYKADTLVDWQAVQLWRIEWLLAAAAALLAGILLKRKT